MPPNLNYFNFKNMCIKNYIIRVTLAIFAGIVLNSCSAENGVSCPKVKNGDFSVSATSINVYYEGAQEANSYLVEYGPAGFTQGTGISQATSNNSATFSNLIPSTTYDVYVTSICSAEDRSQPYKMLSITTNPSECTGAASLSFFQYNPNSIDLTCSYSMGSPEKYDIEYGIHGFALGSGTKISTTSSQNTLSINNIQGSTHYDFYIRAACSSTDASAYTKFEYTTIDHCPKPINLNTYNVSGSCNVGLGETRAFSWSYPYGVVGSYTISLVSDRSTNPDAGNTSVTSSNGISFSRMYCNWKAFYVKATCTDGSSSAWAGPYYFN